MYPEHIKVDVPEPPALLPPDLREQWKQLYAERYRQVVSDEGLDYRTQVGPEHDARRNKLALRAANRLLATSAIVTYEEAKALPDWQVIFREEKDGVLKLMTIDAKKYIFEKKSTNTE